MAKKQVVLGVLWSVAAVLLPTPILADQSPVVTQAIAKIVEDRDRTAEYVLEIKRKYKPDDADYQQARDLYVTALAKHNAWIITLKTVIQKGKTKNLGSDEPYQKIAAEAEQATQAFVSYVQSRPKATVSRGGIGPAALASLGLNIWSGIRGKRQQARDEEADRFVRETQWSRWEEIKADG
jgi:hypothetical protein